MIQGRAIGGLPEVLPGDDLAALIADAEPGLRAGDVVAVSPLVGGEVVKGPTAAFLAWAGFELTAAGVAGYYGAVLDGMVSDEREFDPPTPLPAAVLDTLMTDAQSRRRVAHETLRFAEALR